MNLTEEARRGRCSSCSRRVKNDPEANVVFDAGRFAGFLCSRCQTPEQHLEATVNEATVDYAAMTTDAFGRAIAHGKGERP
ncbi:hypothetical protein [Janibacter massiliensis]|uniref:hypothetical protein n=1 Tax=Janibacter massiliensis TaxID=2058291 RepID=UPI00131A5C24|nr:hypothetical protein [Janibacter massiliensis]